MREPTREFYVYDINIKDKWSFRICPQATLFHGSTNRNSIVVSSAIHTVCCSTGCHWKRLTKRGHYHGMQKVVFMHALQNQNILHRSKADDCDPGKCNQVNLSTVFKLQCPANQKCAKL